MATHERNDRVLNIENARIITGVYFGLLAVVFTLVLDATIYALGMIQLIPLFEGTLLAMFVASVFGFIFGKRILLTPAPYAGKVFRAGFVMTLCAIPFYILGFTIYYILNHHDFIVNVSLLTFFKAYIFMLSYGFVLVGTWLAIIAGLAALYLRSRVSYYIFDSLDD